MQADDGRTGSRQAVTLGAVCLAGAVLPASLTGSSVALPDIGSSLHAGLVPVQWVVNAYNVTFACLMLACGALADLVGRRRMFIAGTGLFAACSLVSAVAGDIYLLDVARGLAGVGAAAVLTAGSAMVAASFDGPTQIRAFGVLGSAFGAGLALGPSTAGLLISGLGWRSVYATHMILMLVALAAAPTMADSRDPDATGVDWSGTVTFTGSLFLVTVAVAEGAQIGWTQPLIIGLLAGSVLLAGAFVAAERRQARPMCDLNLLAQPRFAAICLLPLAIAFGFVCLLVLLPSYFIGADAMSSGQAGLLMLTLTLPTLLLPVLSGHLAGHVSLRLLLPGSLLMIAGGAAWLTVIQPHGALVTAALPMAVIGAGAGAAFGVIDGAAVTSVPPERAGMAAGLFNTVRLTSEAVAIAAVSSILVSLLRHHFTGGLAPGLSDPVALANTVAQGQVAEATGAVPTASRQAATAYLAAGYTAALRTTLWIMSAICLTGALGVWALLRKPRANGTAPVVDPAAMAEADSAATTPA
jgi:MFS family permease